MPTRAESNLVFVFGGAVLWRQIPFLAKFLGYSFATIIGFVASPAGEHSQCAGRTSQHCWPRDPSSGRVGSVAVLHQI